MVVTHDVVRACYHALLQAREMYVFEKKNSGMCHQLTECHSGPKLAGSYGWHVHDRKQTENGEENMRVVLVSICIDEPVPPV